MKVKELINVLSGLDQNAKIGVSDYDEGGQVLVYFKEITTYERYPGFLLMGWE